MDLARPARAPPKINQVDWTSDLTCSTVEITVIVNVMGSIIAAWPSCQVTAAIKPREATLPPSKKLPAQVDWRNLGMIGLLIATKIKDGRKMPRVARRAPGVPPRMNPINVAVVKTGPGVICPMATASMSCLSVSHPRRLTKSARRKAKRT